MDRNNAPASPARTVGSGAAVSDLGAIWPSSDKWEALIRRFLVRSDQCGGAGCVVLASWATAVVIRRQVSAAS
jgi:hypothetical protein